MVNTKLVQAGLFLALVANCDIAQAQDTPWYIGLGGGQYSSTSNFETLSLETEFDSTSFTLYGGYRFGRHFALEAQYLKLRDINTTGSILSSPSLIASRFKSSDGLAIFAKPYLPVSEKLQLYTKIGWGEFNHSVSITGTDANMMGFNINGKFRLRDFIWGTGAEFKVSDRFHLDLGYTRQTVDISEFSTWNLSVKYEF